MMAVNYAGCLPSELLEKIVVMVLMSGQPEDASPGLIDPPVPVAEQESMQLAEQSAASMALVCKDWKEAMHSVGWNALLSKRLKGSVPCVPADALWLLRLLRGHARDSMNVTEARAYLRVTSRDLHAYREAQGLPNVVGLRYDLALLVGSSRREARRGVWSAGVHIQAGSASFGGGARGAAEGKG